MGMFTVIEANGENLTGAWEWNIPHNFRINGFSPLQGRQRREERRETQCRIELIGVACKENSVILNENHSTVRYTNSHVS